MTGEIGEHNQLFAAAHAPGTAGIRTVSGRLDDARWLSHRPRRVDRSPLARHLGHPEIANVRATEVTRLAALLLCMMSLLTLDGCAPVILRTPSATHTE